MDLSSVAKVLKFTVIIQYVQHPLEARLTYCHNVNLVNLHDCLVVLCQANTVEPCLAIVDSL